MTYSSSVSISRTRHVRRNQNVVSFQEQARVLGPVSNTIILIVLACLIGLLYLTQVTKTNSYGYKINDLQKQQADLKEKRSDLQLDAARLQSVNNIKDSPVAKNLVSVSPSRVIQN